MKKSNVIALVGTFTLNTKNTLRNRLVATGKVGDRTIKVECSLDRAKDYENILSLNGKRVVANGYLTDGTWVKPTGTIVEGNSFVVTKMRPAVEKDGTDRVAMRLQGRFVDGAFYYAKHLGAMPQKFFGTVDNAHEFDDELRLYQFSWRLEEDIFGTQQCIEVVKTSAPDADEYAQVTDAGIAKWNLERAEYLAKKVDYATKH